MYKNMEIYKYTDYINNGNKYIFYKNFINNLLYYYRIFNIN